MRCCRPLAWYFRLRWLRHVAHGSGSCAGFRTRCCSTLGGHLGLRRLSGRARGARNRSGTGCRCVRALCRHLPLRGAVDWANAGPDSSSAAAPAIRVFRIIAISPRSSKTPKISADIRDVGTIVVGACNDTVIAAPARQAAWPVFVVRSPQSGLSTTWSQGVWSVPTTPT